jgi:hypothetical protein
VESATQLKHSLGIKVKQWMLMRGVTHGPTMIKGAVLKRHQLGDVHLLEELHQMVHVMMEGERAGNRDEIEATIDCINDANNVCMRGEDDILPDANGEAEDIDLGPEDGEDEGYFDIGFGAL